MGNIWYKALLTGLLFMLVLAPFAGFAPLIIVVLITTAWWFLSSLAQVILFGEEVENPQKTEQNS